MFENREKDIRKHIITLFEQKDGRNTVETDVRAADVKVISNGHLGELTVTGEAKGDVKDIKATDWVIYAKDWEKELEKDTDYVLTDGGVEFKPAYTDTFEGERTVTINIGYRYYYVTVTGTKTAPTEPTDPTDNTDPTNPTDNTDPTDPTEPTDPTDNTDPTNPTDNTEPSGNTDPSTTSKNDKKSFQEGTVVKPEYTKNNSDNTSNIVKAEAVNTGDNSDLPVWTIVAAASAAVTATSLIFKKRREEK